MRSGPHSTPRAVPAPHADPAQLGPTVDDEQGPRYRRPAGTARAPSRRLRRPAPQVPARPPARLARPPRPCSDGAVHPGPPLVLSEPRRAGRRVGYGFRLDRFFYAPCIDPGSQAAAMIKVARQTTAIWAAAPAEVLRLVPAAEEAAGGAGAREAAPHGSFLFLKQMAEAVGGLGSLEPAFNVGHPAPSSTRSPGNGHTTPAPALRACPRFYAFGPPRPALPRPAFSAPLRLTPPRARGWRSWRRTQTPPSFCIAEDRVPLSPSSAARTPPPRASPRPNPNPRPAPAPSMSRPCAARAPSTSRSRVFGKAGRLGRSVLAASFEFLVDRHDERFLRRSPRPAAGPPLPAPRWLPLKGAVKTPGGPRPPRHAPGAPGARKLKAALPRPRTFSVAQDFVEYGFRLDQLLRPAPCMDPDSQAAEKIKAVGQTKTIWAGTGISIKSYLGPKRTYTPPPPPLGSPCTPAARPLIR
eukprot:tig00000430_g658.t1